MDDIIDYLDMIKYECESPDEKAWIIMKIVKNVPTVVVGE